MIPEIGLMIGAYIVTRMLHLVQQSGPTRTAKVLATLTIVVAIVTCLDLLLRGTTNLNLHEAVTPLQ